MNTIRPILILDYGSQTTMLIARRLREMKVYAEIVSPGKAVEAMQQKQPIGLIVSGSHQSRRVGGSDNLPFLAAELGIPVLGICYGFHLLCEQLGGKIAEGAVKEYGACKIEILEAHDLFPKVSPRVWMSHGDVAERMPALLQVIAKTENGNVAAFKHTSLPIYGVQFHPEVSHSEGGAQLLRNFAFGVCKATENWNVGDLAEGIIGNIRKQVGSERVICAISGGVDSLVATSLVAKAVGPQALGFLIDTGLMRKGEVAEVSAYLREELHIELRVVDASERFFSTLAGVSDPEEKRKRIGKLFIDEFSREAQSFAGAQWLMQGTIYPDVIESTQIKSHHNVGGLPADIHFGLVEPLRDFFKDEVRMLGKSLGLPDHLLGRHPFPGPGLAIRVLGEVTKERVALLQDVDHLYISYLREKNLYNEIWQAFAALLPVRSVGVKGDERSYEYTIGLRAVTSVDGMTADVYPFDVRQLTEVSQRICNRVKGVNRVVYDVTTKPPATIEWE